jgi:transcriptional regulator with XRE-family HTH domain
MDNDSAATGTALRVMREAQGLTMRQLAEKAGTTYGYISEVERGEKIPSSRWMRAVLDALAQNLQGAA